MFEYAATIIDCHDGDTVRAHVDLGFHVQLTETFRLLGINAPELFGATREQGMVSRNALAAMILGQAVVMRSFKPSEPPHDPKPDSFGRWLVVILLPQPDGSALNICDWMIAEGFAVPYRV
jgi:endonuclease YncB( thermonuclease family)